MFEYISIQPKLVVDNTVKIEYTEIKKTNKRLNEMKIYVGVVEYGEYEDQVAFNLSVGTNKQVVRATVRSYQYPDTGCAGSETSWVETWMDGKKIKSETVKEKYGD